MPETPPTETIKTESTDTTPQKPNRQTLFLLIGLGLFILFVVGEGIYLLAGGSLPFSSKQGNSAQNPPLGLSPTSGPVPTKQPGSLPEFAGENNTKRTADVQTILSAINQFRVDNQNKVPAGVSSTDLEISTTGANICSELVPKYIAGLPIDPISNNKVSTVTDCSAPYNTGYTISLSEANTVTIKAPNAESGQTIQAAQ